MLYNDSCEIHAVHFISDFRILEIPNLSTTFLYKFNQHNIFWFSVYKIKYLLSDKYSPQELGACFL